MCASIIYHIIKLLSSIFCLNPQTIKTPDIIKISVNNRRSLTDANALWNPIRTISAGDCFIFSSKLRSRLVLRGHPPRLGLRSHPPRLGLRSHPPHKKVPINFLMRTYSLAPPVGLEPTTHPVKNIVALLATARNTLCFFLFVSTASSATGSAVLRIS